MCKASSFRKSDEYTRGYTNGYNDGYLVGSIALREHLKMEIKPIIIKVESQEESDKLIKKNKRKA